MKLGWKVETTYGSGHVASGSDAGKWDINPSGLKLSGATDFRSPLPRMGRQLNNQSLSLLPSPFLAHAFDTEEGKLHG